MTLLFDLWAPLLVAIASASQLTSPENHIGGATVLIQTRAFSNHVDGGVRYGAQQTPSLERTFTKSAMHGISCPPGQTLITNVSTCRLASELLFEKFRGVVNNSSWPAGCIHNSLNSAKLGIYYNTNIGGRANTDGGMVCEVQASAMSTYHKNVDHVSVPWASGKRVALLMRGGIFHHIVHLNSVAKSEDCSRTTNVTVSQLLATRSLMTNVVELLESSGSTIDIFVTASTCDRIGEIVEILGKRRVRNVTMFDTHSQRDSVRYALDAFKQLVGGAVGVINNYDVFVFARNDLVYQDYTRQTLSHTDPTKFNFLAPCYDNMNTMDNYEQCRMDTFYMMPSRWFEAFDFVVGAPNACCFQAEQSDRFGGLCMDSGHFCLRALRHWRRGRERDLASFNYIFEESRDQPGLYAQGRQEVAPSNSSTSSTGFAAFELFVFWKVMGMLCSFL